MAEEVKQEEKKKETGKFFAVAWKVLLGLVFLVLGILAVLKWLGLLLMVIKACIGPFLILAAIITFAIARE